MNESDYREILNAAMTRIGSIAKQQEDLEVEASKLRQFIMATVNMLPDEDRTTLLEAVASIKAGTKAKEASLKEACIKVLRTSGLTWLTAAQVRDRVVASGFDFSSYTSNPLASVATTLRRFKIEQVESTTIEGVIAYRAVPLVKRIRKPK